MKRISLMLLVLLAGIFSFGRNHSNTINAIIGDLSFVEKYGTMPDNDVNETERIMVHLSFVENLLRNRNVFYPDESTRLKRTLVLDLLKQYIENAVFPVNYDHQERRPCFIDRNGNICAVGYLIEKTVGRETAEKINAKHQYDYLLDMDNPMINAWATEFGFTLEECAMIQPAYGPPIYTNVYQVPLKTEYGISSAIIGGFNLGVNWMNLSNKTIHPRKLAMVGLLSGTAQIVFGIANVKEIREDNGINVYPVTLSYKEQNTVSYVNIAAGTTTVLTSAFNLWMNKKTSGKKNAVNMFSYPGADNKFVAGVSFKRNL